MKLLFVINLIFLSVGVYQCKSKNSWSENQGQMNWQEAKKKCQEIGMRLPTDKELSLAHKQGLLAKWAKIYGKDPVHYWTSEEPSIEEQSNFESIRYLTDTNTNVDIVERNGVVRCFLLQFN
ncbi:MAG: hypothetical protein KBA66_16130 [Leptospiraceae bacterium]|nr:hypothetical protein [Leptospiraceae bacterium]